MKTSLGQFASRKTKHVVGDSVTLAIKGVLTASILVAPAAAQGPHAALSGRTPVSDTTDATLIHLTPAQRAPVPPHVSYIDGQLSIVAENCSLGDILAAVHNLTGAQVDLPEDASKERMAAQLGPAPTREVLISLLSSTPFNYFIQAGDGDPSAVQSILLTPRKKSGTNGADSTTATDQRRRQNRRFSNQTSPAEETPAAEITTPAPMPQVSESVDNSQASATPLAASPQPMRAAATDIKLASTTDANQPTLSPSEQMMQGLQRLYEERRQMIQQQNQQIPKLAGAN